jgi:hypothetical protein
MDGCLKKQKKTTKNLSRPTRFAGKFAQMTCILATSDHKLLVRACKLAKVSKAEFVRRIISRYLKRKKIT